MNGALACNPKKARRTKIDRNELHDFGRGTGMAGGLNRVGSIQKVALWLFLICKTVPCKPLLIVSGGFTAPRAQADFCLAMPFEWTKFAA
jgi:hypothetical protein